VKVRTLSRALTSENCHDIVSKPGVLEAPFRNLFAEMRAKDNEDGLAFPYIDSEAI
jgi:hypothetical protein